MKAKKLKDREPRMEAYLKKIKDFCTPATYGKGIKVLGGGAEGIVIEFRLNNGKRIALKGTPVRPQHPMVGSQLTVENQRKAFEIQRRLAVKSDLILPVYRQEFCYDKILKPACVGIVAMELGGPDILGYVGKQPKKSQQWWNNLNKQLVQILDFFKKENITHRDLQLSNILLVEIKRPKIKVTDFSFAEEKFDEIYDLRRLVRPIIAETFTQEEIDFRAKVPKKAIQFWSDYIKKHGFKKEEMTDIIESP